jgi:hypothetical protein
MVKYDMVDEFISHLGLKTFPGRKLRSMLLPPTSSLAAHINSTRTHSRNERVMSKWGGAPSWCPEGKCVVSCVLACGRMLRERVRGRGAGPDSLCWLSAMPARARAETTEGVRLCDRNLVGSLTGRQCPKTTRGGFRWRSEAAERSVGMLSIPPDGNRFTSARSGSAPGGFVRGGPGGRRRRAGETNMHACMNIQKHTMLPKSGEARTVIIA